MGCNLNIGDVRVCLLQSKSSVSQGSKKNERVTISELDVPFFHSYLVLLPPQNPHSDHSFAFRTPEARRIQKMNCEMLKAIDSDVYEGRL